MGSPYPSHGCGFSVCKGQDEVEPRAHGVTGLLKVQGRHALQSVTFLIHQVVA